MHLGVPPIAAMQPQYSLYLSAPVACQFLVAACNASLIQTSGFCLPGGHHKSYVTDLLTL